MDRVEIITFARRWFAALNNHAPADELVGFLDLENVEMKFPEATLKGEAQFRSWYETVTRKFFDQDHRIRQIDVTVRGESADVFVIVNWTAHTWEPPAAFSTRIDVDAYQTWRVRRDGKGRLVISLYQVAGMTENKQG